LVFRSIQTIISFLTIIPTTKSSCNDIYYIGRNMYLFPLVGAMIGLLVGILSYGISYYIQSLFTGLIVTGVLIVITGVHHIDALADFADGLMAKGGKENKYKAMHDPAVGSAGVAALILYIAGMIIAISNLPYGWKIFTSIVTAEVIAKYIMVLQAYIGLSAWEGLSSPFTLAMKDKRKLLAATGIMFPIVCSMSGLYTGLVLLGISIGIAMTIHHISNRSFGGISGDVIGSSNEITRLSCLIVLSSLMR
jgi:adenosylcobinamide-GDP ribazoletransferase